MARDKKEIIDTSKNNERGSDNETKNKSIKRRRTKDE